MKEVFISYSSTDLTSAETVRNVLEKNGLSCWMAPRDIPGGSNYTKEIPIAIRNCQVFVLILSKNAQSSHWVLKELDSAVNCGKVILPFMLEDCILNDEFNFLLTGAQRYAAYQKKAEAMETLILRIKSILDTPDHRAAEQAHEEQVTERPAKKIAPVIFSEAKCTACGGSDLTALPRRVVRQGIKELRTMLLIPVLAIVCCFVIFILCSFLLPYESFSILPLLLLIGLVGGGIWGDFLSKKVVKRSRIRNRINSTSYRCNSCGKVFRHEEPINN